MAAILLIAILMGPDTALAAKAGVDRQAARGKKTSLPRHTGNSIHWLAWGEEAFARARTENKPIFLFIGYSSCHWCAVMEKESFSDRQVAALLNQAFITIKVDSEERPDIDQLYMTACQQLSSSCGWPLTIFMTPERQPFLITSSLPRADRAGQPGLFSLLGQVKKQWHEDRAGLLQTARRITGDLTAKITEKAPDLEALVERADLDAAYKRLATDFDFQYGGLGSASKLPRPHNLMFLLRYWHRTSEAQALAMVEKALTATRLGAHYDQLGHGSHRFAVDQALRPPHFENMLSDQALLTMAYLEAYQATRKPEYAAVAREIITKLLLDRAGGPQPASSDTVLVDKNGLMIAALASAAIILDEPAHGEAAARAADFILTKMVDTSGRLRHRWRPGEAGLAATAADYACLIWGLTELYEWSFEPRWLEAGLKLNNDLIEHFWDQQRGGFFLTPDYGEALLVRTRPIRDQELPSANSVALFNLLRLSRLTSRPGFEEKAAELVKAFSAEVKKAPADHAMFMAAASLTLWPSHEVVIVGSRGNADTQAMFKALRERFIPDAVVQFRPAEQARPAIVQSAPFMEFMTAASGKATAYVCTDFNCKLPTTDIDRMLHLLQPPVAGR